jgi:hypothetical protein
VLTGNASNKICHLLTTAAKVAENAPCRRKKFLHALPHPSQLDSASPRSRYDTFPLQARFARKGEGRWQMLRVARRNAGLEIQFAARIAPLAFIFKPSFTA